MTSSIKDYIVHNPIVYEKAIISELLPKALINSLVRRHYLANLRIQAKIISMRLGERSLCFDPHTKELINLENYCEKNDTYQDNSNVVINYQNKNQFLHLHDSDTVTFCMREEQGDNRKEPMSQEIWRIDGIGAQCAVFHPYKEAMAVIGTSSGKILLWDVKKNTQKFILHSLKADRIPCVSMAFDPHRLEDHPRLAIASSIAGFNKIYIYNFSQEEPRVFDLIDQETQMFITQVQFDPFQRDLLAITTSYPGRIYIVDLDEGIQNYSQIHDGYLSDLTYDLNESGNIHCILDCVDWVKKDFAKALYHVPFRQRMHVVVNIPNLSDYKNLNVYCFHLLRKYRLYKRPLLRCLSPFKISDTLNSKKIEGALSNDFETEDPSSEVD